jgi:DNA repair exonuclease SbcCD nuclease subunit
MYNENGYAFENDSLRHCPFAGYRTEDPGAYNVLLGHGEFAPDTKYCPLTEEHIAAFGADYTALGHVHNAPDPVVTEGLAYAHCGCVEGRGFDEPGEKGAIYVEIEKENGVATVTCEKLRFGRRRYEKIKVSVDGMTSLSEVENAIATAVEAGEFGSDTLLRVTLTGRVAPTVILSEALLAFGKTEAETDATIRISLSHHNTVEEADALIDALREIVTTRAKARG